MSVRILQHVFTLYKIRMSRYKSDSNMFVNNLSSLQFLLGMELKESSVKRRRSRVVKTKSMKLPLTITKVHIW